MDDIKDRALAVFREIESRERSLCEQSLGFMTELAEVIRDMASEISRLSAVVQDQKTQIGLLMRSPFGVED